MYMSKRDHVHEHIWAKPSNTFLLIKSVVTVVTRGNKKRLITTPYLIDYHYIIYCVVIVVIKKNLYIHK